MELKIWIAMAIAATIVATVPAFGQTEAVDERNDLGVQQTIVEIERLYKGISCL